MADIADIAQDLMNLKKRIESNRPKVPREFFFPEPLVVAAAEQYKDTDWIINGHDGSQYLHGVQITKPSTSIPVVFLNARIETMDLPDYLKTLHTTNHALYLRHVQANFEDRIYCGSAGCGKSFIHHLLNAEEDEP